MLAFFMYSSWCNRNQWWWWWWWWELS